MAMVKIHRHGEGVVEIDEADLAQPGIFVPPPPPITPLEFMQRFTKQERAAIRKSSNEDVQDFFDLLRAASSFQLDHPLVVEGTALLVSQKLITQARRSEIIEPSAA